MTIHIHHAIVSPSSFESPKLIKMLRRAGTRIAPSLRGGGHYLVTLMWSVPSNMVPFHVRVMGGFA
jgi:hypothetical protein